MGGKLPKAGAAHTLRYLCVAARAAGPASRPSLAVRGVRLKISAQIHVSVRLPHHCEGVVCLASAARRPGLRKPRQLAPSYRQQAPSASPGDRVS